MAATASPRAGLYEALPGRVARAVDHARLAPLVDDEARARALAVLDPLTVPVHTVCYECRLAPGDARVDVGVRMIAMRALGADDVLGELGRGHRAEPAWRRCLAWLAGWTSPGSPFAAAIPFTCVAFDRPGDPAALPAPALSLCIDREFFARQHGVAAPPAPAVAELIEVTRAAHHHLHAAPLPAACAAQIERALAGDPAVLARHVSFMVSRTPATVKLDLRLPIERVGALLRRLDPPSDPEPVVAQLRALAPDVRHVQLNLVVHPAATAPLEVELACDGGPASTAPRLALLGRLVAAGHCDPAKADALSDAWLRPVSHHADGLIVARSWYVKARIAAAGVVDAKAYVALMPRVLADAPAAAPTGAPR